VSASWSGTGWSRTTKTAAAPGHHHDSQGARFGTLRAPWGYPNVP
jgi:hypothetical protein